MSFEPSGLGRTIFEQRYARTPDESWTDACVRVGSHVANAERPEVVQRWTERFSSILADGAFMPGGRIWYGAGRPKAQLLNCFVIPTSDSREGWGRTISDTLIVSGLGGGVGVNGSVIRPYGTEIRGTGGLATGPLSLFRAINAVGEEIRAGGGRRTALMLCLNANHPDITRFIDAKFDRRELTNANISVVLPNDLSGDSFAASVRAGDSIELSFGGRGTGTFLESGKLWESIVHNAWDSGEPGVLNGHLANEENNIFYHKKLISTNPCGEIWLEPYGCCDLGALVLPRFVKAKETDWDVLDSTIRTAVRFLDNVLSINYYPLSDIGENCAEVRRVGLGVMGLHSYLLDLGYKYSSSEGHNAIETLFSFIKHTAYDASINLAIEKGTFPAYSPEILQSGYLRRMKRGIRNKIKEHGLRNCALLTIAPTGTTSMVAGVSSGIEPILAPAYKRRYWKGEERVTETVVSPEFRSFGSLAEGAGDIQPRDHFEIQRIVQSHIDNAVSKTINLPKDYPKDALSELWLDYLPHIKGSTFYRWGSRDNEPISPIAIEDVQAAWEDPNKADHFLGFDIEETQKYLSEPQEANGELTEGVFDPSCPTGVCEL